MNVTRRAFHFGANPRLLLYLFSNVYEQKQFIYQGHINACALPFGSLHQL